MNFEALQVLSHCFRIKLDYKTTTAYIAEVDPNTILAFRPLVNGKKDMSVFEGYIQVFDDKYGFINNLSVLDLLFNEGKFALDYLKRQELIIR